MQSTGNDDGESRGIPGTQYLVCSRPNCYVALGILIVEMVLGVGIAPCLWLDLYSLA